MNIQYDWSGFTELSLQSFHDILQLRQQVFIIEQASLYPDIDGYDPIGLHLTARDAPGSLVGCLRLLPPGTTNRRPAIGRLAIAQSFRGQKMGHGLMTAAISKTNELYPGSEIYISAQEHLTPFYQELGFHPRGEPYDEDGIMHIDMIRTAPGGDSEL